MHHITAVYCLSMSDTISLLCILNHIEDDAKFGEDGVVPERRSVLPAEMVLTSSVLEIRTNDSWATKVSAILDL